MRIHSRRSPGQHVQWHRLGVYYGVRDDPELRARWKSQGTDIRTLLIGLPLGLAAVVVAFGAVAWAIASAAGRGTSVSSAAWGGLQLFWTLVALASIVRVIGWARRRNRR